MQRLLEFDSRRSLKRSKTKWQALGFLTYIFFIALLFPRYNVQTYKEELSFIRVEVDETLSSSPTHKKLKIFVEAYHRYLA